MREIPLTQGKVALVDDEDFERVAEHRWCADKIGNIFYARSTINGKKIRMHRFILGLTDVKIDTDHIDGNGLNNCRTNIHATSRSFNARQKNKYNFQGKTSSSHFKGVYWDKRKNQWHAQLKFMCHAIACGYHATEEAAARAYDRKVLELMGTEKAIIGRILNFPIQIAASCACASGANLEGGAK